MKYYLDLFGCAKNQVDAEMMMARLNEDGWVSAEASEDADLIIVNSCGFIESAKRESINAVLEWRNLYPHKKIALVGCLAMRYADELAASLPEADILFAGDPSGLSGALLQGFSLDNSEKGEKKEKRGERPLLSLPGSAYIKISEGCDNRCSFCSIPLIRGGLRSRRIESIVEECAGLLKRGVKELCLIGQDIASFGKDRGGEGLEDLLKAVSALRENFWLRLLYLHPDHFPLPILDIIHEDPRFLPYFDIPFQHGSDVILKKMNRKKSGAENLALIEKIRTSLPDAVIRSTFLVGFPGETDADMEKLFDFQEKASLDWLGCFTYSREEKTPAYAMKPLVSKKIAEQRKTLVEKKQIPITEKQMSRFIGRSLDVLIEEKVEGEDLYLGRLFCHAPEVDGSAVVSPLSVLQIGGFIRGKVFSRAGFDLSVAEEA